MLPRIRLPAKRILRSKRCTMRSFTSDQPILADPSHPPPQLHPEFPGTPTPTPLPLQIPQTSSKLKPPMLDIPPESDPLLGYVTSLLMHDGKRHAAAHRTSRLLLHLHAMTRSPPLPILREAVFLAAPSIRIVSHKKGAKNVQKPIPLGERQRARFAINWMLEAAKSRPGKRVEERLAREILDIIKQDKDNSVLRKKEAVHKLGMVNRANAKSQI